MLHPPPLSFTSLVPSRARRLVIPSADARDVIARGWRPWPSRAAICGTMGVASRLGLPAYVRRCLTHGNHRATAPPSSSFSIRLDPSAALHVPRLPVVDFEGAYAPLRPSAV